MRNVYIFSFYHERRNAAKAMADKYAPLEFGHLSAMDALDGLMLEYCV